jgi:hypothetical protein
LSQDEAVLWAAIVDERDPNFFDAASRPILADYCRIETAVRQLDELLNAADRTTDDGIDRYKTLIAERDRIQGRRLGIAKALRSTQQARYVPDSKRARPGVEFEPPPWETIHRGKT